MYNNHNQREQRNIQTLYNNQYLQKPKTGFWGISKTNLILAGVVLTIVILFFLYRLIRGNHIQTMFSLKDIMAALPSEA